MWQNEQQNFDFLDAITILSFVLQLQNRESHEIEKLKNDLDRTMNEEVKARLDEIDTKLDMILQKLG